MLRRWPRGSRWTLPIVLVVVVTMIGVPSASQLSSGAGPSAPAGRALDSTGSVRLSMTGSASVRRAVFATVNSTAGADDFATIHGVALFGVLLDNYSAGLFFYRAANNSTWAVDPALPGGVNTSILGVNAVGDWFLVTYERYHPVTGITDHLWLRVSLSGKVTPLKLPVGPLVFWGVAFANATSIYVTAQRFLVEIDPATRAIVANYTRFLPKTIVIDSALPINDSLYLAGSRLYAGRSLSAYFGYLNVTSDRLTNVSRPETTYGSNLTGYFDAMEELGSTIYLGGGLAVLGYLGPGIPLLVVQRWASPYLFEYNTSSSSYRNRTSLIPDSDTEIEGFAPWSKTLALVDFNYTFNNTGAVETFFTGVYTVSDHGQALVNQSALFPTNEAALIGGDPLSVSGGWIFLGGCGPQSANFIAEISAIKL